jgi:hypothetical protein
MSAITVHFATLPDLLKSELAKGNFWLRELSVKHRELLKLLDL